LILIRDKFAVVGIIEYLIAVDIGIAYIARIVVIKV